MSEACPGRRTATTTFSPCATSAPSSCGRRDCDGLSVTKVGTSANETINGTAGLDVIHGLGGKDVIRSLAGNDIVCGGPGNDQLFGGSDDDRLFGDAGTALERGTRFRPLPRR
ncbi:MAG: calcium-binding protein [Gammaproteobacteria bacterium]|nr:hypothetical protein [Gammaproteobacteria bacterium]